MRTARPILLIGSNGQLGWELRRTLSPLGHVVVANRPALDLASPESITAAIRQAAPSLVVNAAAYTAVDRAEQEEELAQAINGSAPAILAEEAKRLGIPLVHYSTDYVFDGKALRPYVEDDPVRPLGAYGRSKLEGEQAIAAVAGIHFVFRTSWVYSMRGANFLLTIQRLAREREELRVVADQHGAPTWARSIAEATAAILAQCRAPCDAGAIAERSGLYHMTAAGQTTWHGFASAIVDAMREDGEPVTVRNVVPITTAEYPTPAVRPSYSVLDNSKLADAFGIAIHDWRDQLHLCLGRGGADVPA